jgi:hypothetical protein
VSNYPERPPFLWERIYWAIDRFCWTIGIYGRGATAVRRVEDSKWSHEVTAPYLYTIREGLGVTIPSYRKIRAGHWDITLPKPLIKRR